MYQVYIDGKLIHDLRVDGLKLFEPKLSHEINKAGSFTFTVYSSHPYISTIGKKLKPIITVDDDSGTIWRGRVLNTNGGFYNQEQCTCEGELAFFNDSIVRTYNYSGGLAGYFDFLVNQHNDQVDEEKRFMVGNVTVTDPNDYVHFSSNQYPKTLSELKEKLVDKYGGYLWFRHESDGVYIDYLDDSDLFCNQTVELGKNLIDLSNVVKGQDVATIIIPRGAVINDETGERVSVESVNDGKDYVANEEAVELFGKIQRVVEFDDVTEPANLLRKGQEYAADAGNLIASMTFTAADLYKSGSQISNFRLFRYVAVLSKVHGINEKYLIKKIDIDLNDPMYGKLSVGKTVKTLIDKQLDYNGKYGKIVERVEKVESNAKINEGAIEDLREDTNSTIIALREEVGSQITQSAESVKTAVYDNVYVKDEVNSLVSSVSTEVEQTKDSWQITFNQFQADVDDIANGNDAKFEEIKKYIRFEDGNILLGNSESPLVLKIQNDRIQFLQNGYEVAYISDRKMYNTICSVIDRLEIGDSAWQVEHNEDGDTVVSLMPIY